MIIFYKDSLIRKATAPNIALTQLQSFLNTKEPQLVKFLQNTWRNQGKAITYKELRQAILSGSLDKDMIESWQQDYSRFVTEYMLPDWQEAMDTASQALAVRYPSFSFDGTAAGVRQWTSENGARFVTNSTTTQIEGLSAVIQRASVLKDINIDELARVIRPMVGLTYQQSVANLNYYQKLIENGMKAEKAKAKSIIYSAKQQRYRAQMIARTETAFAYNQGQYFAVKQAQNEGLMGRTKKIWVTADTERTCEFCASLDGKEIDMDDEFDIQTNLKSGMIRLVPPAHPHCMCAINYVEVEPPEIESTSTADNAQPETNAGYDDDSNQFTFTPATSIKEANEYATNVLGISNANYKGTTVEMANEWNKGLTDNFNRIPELAKGFEFVGTCQNRNKFVKKKYYSYVMDRLKRVNPGYTEKELDKAVKRYITQKYAQTISSDIYAQSTKMQYAKGITISDKWKGEELLKALQEDVIFKFHPQGCDTVKAILDHEIGHQIDDLLDLWDNPEITKIYRSMTPGEMTNALSRYAWDNSNKIEGREFIAECWSEYLNNPQPRPVAKQVGEIIEEVYKQANLS